MKGEIRASISAVAAAVMLVACASNGPASSKRLTTADNQGQTSAEYQSLIDNAGKQPLICQREFVQGSRIATQVCLTPAQIEQQRRDSDDLVRDIRKRDETYRRQQIPVRPPQPMPMPPARQ